MRKITATMACLAIAASTVITTTGPASAATCGVRSGRAVSSDAAWVLNVGTCFYVRVQHYYDPAWSMHNYWTNWYGGSGTSWAYYTPNTAVYVKHRAEAW